MGWGAEEGERTVPSAHLGWWRLSPVWPVSTEDKETKVFARRLHDSLGASGDRCLDIKDVSAECVLHTDEALFQAQRPHLETASPGRLPACSGILPSSAPSHHCGAAVSPARRASSPRRPLGLSSHVLGLWTLFSHRNPCSGKARVDTDQSAV